MKYSYDYEEFIDDLEMELTDQMLTLQSPIQILRADQPVFENYYPIIDWYYCHQDMLDLMPDFDDDQEDIEQMRMIQVQYQSVQHQLIQTTVAQALEEMKKYDQIL